MWKTMVCGAAALAWACLPASAGPDTADLWVGFDGTENGFLIDEDTGRTWMTGVCLIELGPSARTPDGWVSRNRTMEPVGRLSVELEQNFTFALGASGLDGVILVDNPARGGVQSFPAVVRRCADGAVCAAAAAQAPC